MSHDIHYITGGDDNMEFCDVCGERLKVTVWYEEAWGRPIKIVERECLNEHCGEEQCEECGEYESECTCEEEM